MACDVDNPWDQLRDFRVSRHEKERPKEVEQLESAMAHSAIVLRDTGVDIASLVWGSSAWRGPRPAPTLFSMPSSEPGADLILEKLNFARSLDNADLVIVSEGASITRRHVTRRPLE